jgi:ABC-type Na+ efflux pump permease subunit
MFGWTLSRFPLSAKVFCTLFLVGIGCGSLAAFAQVFTSIGLTPGDIQASLAPEMPMAEHMMGEGIMSAEHEIRMSDVEDKAKVWIRTPLLIQTSHTHLFGMTLIAGLLGLIFLFASLDEKVKAVIVALPLVGTPLDIGGMWLTRFVWPSLAVVVVLGGTLFWIGYLLITGVSLYQLWLKKEVA